MRDFVLIGLSAACGILGVVSWNLSSENAQLRQQLDAKQTTATAEESSEKASEKIPRSERLKRAATLDRAREGLKKSGAPTSKLSMEERRKLMEERKAAAQAKGPKASGQDKGFDVKSYEDRMSEQISDQVAQMSKSESWDEETSAEVEEIIADTLSYRKELQESFRAGEISREDLIESIKEDKLSRESELLELVGAEGPKLMRNSLRPAKPTSSRAKIPSAPSGIPIPRSGGPSSSD